MKIYIPSYKRAGAVITNKIFPTSDYKIVICEKQYADYKQYHDQNHLFVIPDELDGSDPRKRNAILEIIRNEDGFGIVADDDIRRVRRIRDRADIDEVTFLSVFENLFSIAEGIGAKYCGLCNTDDFMKYRGDFNPFSFYKPFWFCIGIIDSDIRYDESLKTGCDADFYFMQMLQYRKVVRDNRYFAEVLKNNQDTGVGVADAARGADNRRIQERWGKHLVILKEDGSVKNIKQPYKGI